MADLSSPEIFRELYQGLGVNALEPLHRHCPNASICWSGAEHRFPPLGTEWNYIPRPWVGQYYDRLRILMLGINMNGSGGFDEGIALIRGAQAEMRVGRIKVRFGLDYKRYSGTILFHRMGAYAHAFAEIAGLVADTSASGAWPSTDNAADGLEYLAYANQIKCSPFDDQESGTKRSEPQSAMWENCGRHILASEIQLLAPRVIIVLGLGDNFLNFVKHVLDAPPIRVDVPGPNGHPPVFRGVIRGKETTLFVVKHPTGPGGNKLEVLHLLRAAAEQQREHWLNGP